MSLQTLEVSTPYLDLDEEFYDLITPQELEKPYLISFNEELSKEIGFELLRGEEKNFIDLLNTTFTLKGSTPFAMCYAGHQFGHYNPWMGDGRACNLGKVNKWNLQLKGSGETLYSRSADGRAAVRSSIREYLMSEAMHHLHIPTTRALGIIGSQTKLIRNRVENGAIVLRMAKSWVRFGTFEYFYYRKRYEKLEALAEYVINESFPHLKETEERFGELFSEIVYATANTVAMWQGIGFNHGVMNTDNMCIDGSTIDYGPFAMLDDFNYNYVCNNADKIGRYAYGEQPNIAYWNLTKLGDAFSPLVSKEKIKQILEDFGSFIYPDAYIQVIKKKLGLLETDAKDEVLVDSLVSALHEAYVDHTLFYRTLSSYDGDRTPLYDIAMNPVAIDEWLKLYDVRLAKETISKEERKALMLQNNPKYILKNYMLEEAIVKAEQGDFSMVEMLLKLGQHPYDEMPEYEIYAGDTPEEYKNIGLSCSS